MVRSRVLLPRPELRFFAIGTGLEMCSPGDSQSMHPLGTPSDGAGQVLEPPPQAELSVVLVSQAPAKSSSGEVGGVSLGPWKLRAGACALV